MAPSYVDLITTSAGGTGANDPLDYTNIIAYLNKNFLHYADVISDNGYGRSTALFTGAFIAPVPAGFAQGQTMQENFYFFINGQLLGYHTIVNFVNTASGALLTVDSDALGFVFQSTDEIIAEGRFDS